MASCLLRVKRQVDRSMKDKIKYKLAVQWEAKQTPHWCYLQRQVPYIWTANLIFTDLYHYTLLWHFKKKKKVKVLLRQPSFPQLYGIGPVQIAFRRRQFDKKVYRNIQLRLPSCCSGKCALSHCPCSRPHALQVFHHRIHCRSIIWCTQPYRKDFYWTRVSEIDHAE